MRTTRIEAFSDGVFSIAITLLALEIRPPTTTAHLTRALRALWPSYTAYALSFLLIGLVWANHHAMFEHIRRGDRMLLLLNTLLLMDVAFLPFVTSVVALALRAGAGLRPAVVLYGGTWVVGGAFFNAIWQWARRNHRLLDSDLGVVAARRIGRRFLAGPLLYLVGTLVGAIAPLAGLAVFAGLALLYWLPFADLTARRRDGRQTRPRT